MDRLTSHRVKSLVQRWAISQQVILAINAPNISTYAEYNLFFTATVCVAELSIYENIA